MYKRLFPSLETIQQQDDRFFKELTSVIESLRNKEKNPYKWEKSDYKLIEKTINKYTEIPITVSLLELGFSILVMDNLTTWSPTKGYSSDFDSQIISKLKKQGFIEGAIDRKSGRVKGIFTDLHCELFIDPKVIERKDITSEEIVSLMFHEIGHVFSYYEFLSRSFTTNWALKEIADGLTGKETFQERKTLLIATLGDITGGRVNLEKLAKVSDSNQIASIIIADQVAACKSDIGSDIYDVTSWEYLSDQYVSRLGAGRAFITAYDKVFPKNRKKNNHDHLFIKALKNIGFIATSPITVCLLPVYALMGSGVSPIYDRPETRLTRIRLDMVRNLKDKNLPDSIKKQIREDIEYIDSVSKLGQDKLNFAQYLLKNIFGKNRDRFNQEKMQLELEKLASSDLYLKAYDLEKLI